MTEQEINNLIDSKIGKTKMSQLPEATQTSGLYSIGYTGNQSVKYKSNLLQGDPLTVRKTYQTEVEALADKNPIDPTTSLPLTVGQFISIVDDGEKNGIYRIGSIGGDGTMSLELQGKLGDLSDYAKQSVVEEIKDVVEKQLIFKNEVIDGSFKQGIDNISYTHPRVTASHVDGRLKIEVVNGELTSYINIFSIEHTEPNTNDLYYFSAKINTTHPFYLYGINGKVDDRVSINVGDNHISVLMTPDSTKFNFFSKYTSPDIPEGAVMYFDDIIKVNLSKCFGEDNIPTLSDIENLIDGLPDKYFDGVLEEWRIINMLDNRLKSDILQVVDEKTNDIVTNKDISELSEDIFKSDNLYLFPEANLPVIKLTTSGATDLTPGTWQTSSPDGLAINVNAEGSAATKHYFRTGLFLAGQNIYAKFIYKGVPGTTESIGFGYIGSNGDYIIYTYTALGSFRKYTNDTRDFSVSGFPQLDTDDTFTINIYNKALRLYVNDSLVHTYLLEDNEFDTEILIGQTGFQPYVAKIESTSDPIRDYVKGEIASTASKDLPRGFYEYDLHTDTFYAYTQIVNEFYARAQISHEIKESAYLDYWRLTAMDLYRYDSVLAEMYPTDKRLVSIGENECVYRVVGSDDATGGGHGNEHVTNLEIYVDGVNIGMPENDIPLTPCGSFRYVAHSTIHKTPISGETDHSIECNHIKVTDIVNGGYKTYNRLDWVVDMGLIRWYHNLSCISKDTASSYYSNKSFSEIIRDGTQPNIEEPGAREMHSCNPDKGLSAFVTSRLISPEERDKDGVMFVSDRVTDSKYYRRISGLYPKIGDIWESEMTVIFNKTRD